MCATKYRVFNFDVGEGDACRRDITQFKCEPGRKKGLRRVAGNGVEGKHPRNFDAAYATSRYVPINSTVLDIVFSEFLSALRSFSHCFVIVTEHQVHIYILYCLS